MVMGVLAGCGDENTAGGGSSASADAESTGTGNTLVVGFDQNFPPMGFVGDDGEYTG